MQEPRLESLCPVELVLLSVGVFWIRGKLISDVGLCGVSFVAKCGVYFSVPAPQEHHLRLWLKKKPNRDHSFGGTIYLGLNKGVLGNHFRPTAISTLHLKVRATFGICRFKVIVMSRTDQALGIVE